MLLASETVPEAQSTQPASNDQIVPAPHTNSVALPTSYGTLARASSPLLPSPQQRAPPPPTRTPHVWCSPIASCAKVAPSVGGGVPYMFPQCTLTPAAVIAEAEAPNGPMSSETKLAPDEGAPETTP